MNRKSEAASAGPTEVVDVISPHDLENYLGHGIGEAYLRGLRASRNGLIPNYDELLVGDVILARNSDRRKHILSRLLPSIEAHQQSIDRFQKGDAAAWTHAMLYVGRLHVVESQKNSRAAGITVSQLIKPKRVELVICRRKDAEEIQEFDAYRRNAALYALMDHAVSRRVYDLKRIAAIAMDGRGRLSSIAGHLFPPDFRNAIICSEFVLEALAIGGKMLTADWEALKSPQTFFYPADYFIHPAFSLIPMTYLSLAT